MVENEFDFEARWIELGKRVKVFDFASWELTFDALVALYSENGRHYHTLEHVRNCLEKIDMGKEIAKDLDAIEVAIWFHDAFYDIERHDNEERSAVFAKECLINAGVSRDFAANVQRMILFTKHTDRPNDIDAQLVVDLDLCGLGAPRSIFVKNTEDIRKEYKLVQTKIFRSERANILQSFLNRNPIYLTEPFRAKYEKAARENLQKSIKELR